MKPDLARGAFSTVHLPSVSGLEVIDGLGEWQGPYPQWNIDRFSIMHPDRVLLQIPDSSQSKELYVRKSLGWELSVLSGERERYRMDKDETSATPPTRYRVTKLFARITIHSG